MADDLKSKMKEFTDLINSIGKNIENLQSPGITFPSTKEIKINIVITSAKQGGLDMTREQAIEYIESTDTTMWDSFIDMTVSELKAMFPTITGLYDQIKDVVDGYVKSTSLSTAAGVPAKVIPVTVTGGAGTANASTYDTAIQKQFKNSDNSTSKSLKPLLIQCAKEAANILAKMGTLMLFDLIDTVKPILETVNNALALYSKIPSFV